MKNALKTILFTVFALVLFANTAISASENNGKPSEISGELPKVGLPDPWQISMIEGLSPVKEKVHVMHDALMIIITVIAAFVGFLMLYVIFRFNAKRNPIPSKTTHNVKLEVIWTLIPALILVAITIPSLQLLYYMDKTEEAGLTVKVRGHQWYWSYEYPDHGGFKFDSNMIEEKDLKKGDLRLLEVDNRMVVPVDTNVRILTSATDVIHAWAVPALGVKKDAIPGKINETWFRANKVGIYYGQCSELCGVRHGYMPIVVEVLPKEQFDKWLEKAKDKFAYELNPQIIQTAAKK